jgi:hypothetical protein
MSLNIQEDLNKSLELKTFITSYLDSSYIISTKTLTLNKTIIYNLKTKNFSQDIGFITFISDPLLLDNIYITLFDFVLLQNLKNYLFIIYFNTNNVFISIGYKDKILSSNIIYKGINVYNIFKDILNLKGYIFKEKTYK